MSIETMLIYVTTVLFDPTTTFISNLMGNEFQRFTERYYKYVL